MAKNIIICCDGTGNQFGDTNSNVVNLYGVIERTEGEQIAYYDPGLGTDKYTGIGFSLGAIRRKVLGLMSGFGIYENIYEAYVYLMENYEEGDKVFLFGFSRGAYTVRVLAGFIHLMGLLEKGSQNLIPYAFKLYAERPVNFRTTGQFKARFSRECPIHFLGVWDTVSSIGYLWNLKSYPHTANNEDIATVRHAVAIDERRSFYTPNKIGTTHQDKNDIKEVWFSGVHSDVGGSYQEAESGLAKIALQWMLNEAKNAGLAVNEEKYAKYVMGKQSDKLTGPDYNAMIHQSLKGFWRFFEYIPRYKPDYDTNTREWFIPRGRSRFIEENALIHESVLQRAKDADRTPENLPKVYRTEPITETISPP